MWLMHQDKLSQFFFFIITVLLISIALTRCVWESVVEYGRRLGQMEVKLGCHIEQSSLYKSLFGAVPPSPHQGYLSGVVSVCTRAIKTIT